MFEFWISFLFLVTFFKYSTSDLFSSDLFYFRSRELWTSRSRSRHICENENFSGSLKDNACHRQVMGYDITGVTNTVEIDSGINSVCDCIHRCIEAAGTCDSWVWKFTSPGQTSRVCILYSNFNLPSGVTLGYNTTSTSGAGLIEDNPQGGGFIPACTMADGTTPDPDCFSGVLWQVDENSFFC